MISFFINFLFLFLKLSSAKKLNYMDEATNSPLVIHSSDTFPMKIDILKIRNNMSSFQIDINHQASKNSILCSESHISQNNQLEEIIPKSQTVQEISLFKTIKGQEKSTKFNANNTILEEKKTFISNMLMPIVKRSHKKMRNSTVYRKMEDLKEYHLNIINDRAAFLASFLLEDAFRVRLKIFKPFQPFVMLIKCLAFLNLLSLFLYIPLETGFSKNFSPGFTDGMNIISLFLLVIETVIRFNLGYFSNGTFIKNRKLILKNYFQRYFLVDFLGVFAVFSEFYIIRPQTNKKEVFLKLLKFLIFAKGIQFRHLYRELVQYFKLDVILRGSLQLIELLVFSCFIAHLIACLWYFFGMVSIDVGYMNNWIDLANISHMNWETHYLYSLYWAVVVMMTVGFGDIHPTNTCEMSYCILAIYMGCALYAYNLNKIGIILQKIYQEENEFNEELRIINNFMERKKVDSELQSRIKEYLRFIWNEKKTEHNTKEMEIINTLSNSLREELLLESYGGIIKAFPLFYKKFSEKSLKTMVSCITEFRFVPGDYIFHEKELDECCFYYINRGNVDLTVEGENLHNNHLPNHKTVLETLQEGQVFGSDSFFTGMPRIYTAQSTEFVSLLAIKRADFIRIIEKTPSDYEQFCMIKDSLIFNSNPSFVEGIKKCRSCNTNAHFTLHCPLIQYIPDREKIIKRYEFSHLQERSSFSRLLKRSKSSLVLQKNSIKIICKFQKDLKKSATVFNFSHLRAIMNNNELPDSNIFDSKGSIASMENENIESSRSLSSSSDDVDENIRSMSEENLGKDVTIKENIKKIYDKVVNEESKRMNLNMEEVLEEMKESKELSKKFFEVERQSSSLNTDLRKNDRLPSYKNPTTDIEYKRMPSKQHSHIEKKPTINSIIMNANNISTNNIVIPSVTKLNTRKKSTNSTKTPAELLPNFEKGEVYEHYFPCCNVDNVISNYDKKRRKLAYLKKFHPSKESLFFNNSKTNTTVLKDFGKYSFFPHQTVSQQEKQKDNNNTTAKTLQAKNSCSSPFFKRKEFQKKTISFQSLVQGLLSNKAVKK